MTERKRPLHLIKGSLKHILSCPRTLSFFFRLCPAFLLSPSTSPSPSLSLRHISGELRFRLTSCLSAPNYHFFFPFFLSASFLLQLALFTTVLERRLVHFMEQWALSYRLVLCMSVRQWPCGTIFYPKGPRVKGVTSARWEGERSWAKPLWILLLIILHLHKKANQNQAVSRFLFLSLSHIHPPKHPNTHTDSRARGDSCSLRHKEYSASDSGTPLCSPERFLQSCDSAVLSHTHSSGVCCSLTLFWGHLTVSSKQNLLDMCRVTNCMNLNY